MVTEEEVRSIKQRFGIIGNSSELNHAIRVAVQVASTDMTVLVRGESGSGKESFSKIIHLLSRRKHGEFIAVNCGAIPEGTIDSELFGHEKGAFTGAVDNRKGYFEVTDGGTIFLDEVAEMPMSTQARLLRVLENGEFIKVGSSKIQKTDVRVVAATNVDLVEAVSRNKFREDLYYRLNTVPLFVPPLRTRGYDIDLLFRKFSADYAEKYMTSPIILTDDARDVLMDFHFPGNVRQLRNIVEQISVLETENRTISAGTLARYLPERSPARFPALTGSPEQNADSFSERDVLYKILFDLRSDMTELKQLVLNLLKGESGVELMKQVQNIFPNMDTTGFQDQSSLLLDSPPVSFNYGNGEPSAVTAPTPKDIEYEKIQDITPDDDEPEEEESLSLEKQEKDTIIRALKKNNNKRKYAAKDLGISERTLYRKIKQYELENLNF